MPSTRVTKDYAVRRDEILDSGQRLLYTRGYEQMTIQDILDELQIAKGTFYHYFGSKQALLEATVERLLDNSEKLIRPILEDPALPVLAKLQTFFDSVATFKGAQRDFLMALMRVWFNDDNAMLRQKVQYVGIQRFSPLLAQVLRQGVDEGTLTLTHPDQTALLLMHLGRGLEDAMGRLLLRGDTVPMPDLIEQLRAIAEAYTEGLERLIGAPPGSLRLIPLEELQGWANADSGLPH